jgi:hypothetical protein
VVVKAGKRQLCVGEVTLGGAVLNAEEPATGSGELQGESNQSGCELQVCGTETDTTCFKRYGASRLVMDAEISCRYRTARAVPLRFGAESRWQWAVARAKSMVLLEAEGCGEQPSCVYGL